MFGFGEAIALMALGGALVVMGAGAGGWLVYKSRNAVEGEKFFGGVPKGEVFHLPDTAAEGFPEEEKNVLDRTNAFLDQFKTSSVTGGGQWKA